MFTEFIYRNIYILENAAHQTQYNSFSRMNRNHRRSAIIMSEKEMASTASGIYKT